MRAIIKNTKVRQVGVFPFKYMDIDKALMCACLMAPTISRTNARKSIKRIKVHKSKTWKTRRKKKYKIISARNVMGMMTRK